MSAVLADGDDISASSDTSKLNSTSPTLTMSPTPPAIFMILPSTGDGSSTVALSVIMAIKTSSSTTIWPSFTFNSTISEVTTPSPKSGNKKSKTAII